jgi:hypothetical protein
MTKTAIANLNRIWTEKVAYGATKNRRNVSRLSRVQAKDAGYGWMNMNSSSSLVAKGLARTLVTKDEILGHRVLVLVLTEAGRKAIGV